MRTAIRRIAAVACVFLLPTVALAGDIAAFRSIGFSPDGQYFGFEQYGIQDGSGFPYAEIVVIDVKADRFVEGTPVKVRVDDETATLGQARKQAFAKAQATIDRLKIDTDPGIILAYNGPAEAGIEPLTLSYHPFASDPPSMIAFRLDLTATEMKPNGKCYDGDPHYGFKLTRTGGDPASQTDIVHEDSSIPASRGCPNGYRILGVIANHDPMSAVTIAIIQVNTYGFEGSDGRYIAVPMGQPGQ